MNGEPTLPLPYYRNYQVLAMEDVITGGGLMRLWGAPPKIVSGIMMANLGDEVVI